MVQALFSLADQTDCFVTVHLRHLRVHEADIIRDLLQDLQYFSAIGRRISDAAEGG